MKLHRIACFAGLLVSSAVGCCSMDCGSSCVPSCGSVADCGCEAPIEPSCGCEGAPRSGWLRREARSWRTRYSKKNCGYSDAGNVCEICGTNCGGEFFDAAVDPIYGGNCAGGATFGTEHAGCGCAGQSPTPMPAHNVQTYSAPVQSAPVSSYVEPLLSTPSPAATTIPPMAPAPPTTAKPAPITPATNGATAPAPANEEMGYAPRPQPGQSRGQVQYVSVEEFQRLPGTIVSGSVESLKSAQPSQVTPAAGTATHSRVQQSSWYPSRR